MDVDALTTILSVLFTALIITAIFRFLRLPVVLGYLLVGAIMGPNAIGLIPDISDINHLAEFGVVFLMFTVGLEFSQPKLFALKYTAFVVGGLQVIFTIIFTMIVAIYLGMNAFAAFTLGGIAAMSSTAIVIKQLNDQAELYTPYGLDAIAVLLFQDITVIPLMIFIAAFTNSPEHVLPTIFMYAFLKGLFAILIIFLAGRFLLTPLFRTIAKTRAIELFTLTVLLITLAAAWLTNSLGLSYALGAFLAGMMLSETEFRHQIEIEIRPFRDILLGLFFISIGLLTNFNDWQATWPWILLLLSALIFGKMLLITLICRITGRPWSVALPTGLILAQGGEFGFVLLTLALTYRVISPEYGQVILAAILFSMAISPLLIYFNKKMCAYFLPLITTKQDNFLNKPIPPFTNNLKHHVILCGYGRVGQHIAKLLNKAPYPYIGIDLDSTLIQQANLAGDNVLYGDASHPTILSIAGLKRAKALVICFSDIKTVNKTLSLVRDINPNIPVLIRCKDQNDWPALQNQDGIYIITEIFEESMTLAHQVFDLLNLSAAKISRIMSEARQHNYELLRQVFQSPLNEEITEKGLIASQLTPIQLPSGAYAVGKQLDHFDFDIINAKVITIRHQRHSIKPSPHYLITAGDTIIIYGTTEAASLAERMLLEGKE